MNVAEVGAQKVAIEGAIETVTTPLTGGFYITFRPTKATVLKRNTNSDLEGKTGRLWLVGKKGLAPSLLY